MQPFYICLVLTLGGKTRFSPFSLQTVANDVMLFYVDASKWFTLNLVGVGW